ncbi:MAG: hypothetical protein WAL32_18410 [Terriglobales bacterium]
MYKPQTATKVAPVEESQHSSRLTDANHPNGVSRFTPNKDASALVRDASFSALTLQDVARDGRVLLTRDVPRVGMVGMALGNNKERDLSWMDWSAPKDLSADGKTLLFTESGEAGEENYAAYVRQTDGSPAFRLGDGNGFALSPDKKWVVGGLPKPPVQFYLLPTGAGDQATHARFPISIWSTTSSRTLRGALHRCGRSNFGTKLYNFMPNTAIEAPPA